MRPWHPVRSAIGRAHRIQLAVDAPPGAMALRLATASRHTRSRASRLPASSGLGVKRIGLLGGSFDPIHVAHLALAHAALDALHLDQVQFIPAAHPWQRAPLGAASEHRLRMIELAINGQPQLAANPIELERGGATYTIDTLRALPTDARYGWLLGTDQLDNFCTWRQWQATAEHVDLAGSTRPGTPPGPHRK